MKIVNMLDDISVMFLELISELDNEYNMQKIFAQFSTMKKMFFVIESSLSVSEKNQYNDHLVEINQLASDFLRRYKRIEEYEKEE